MDTLLGVALPCISPLKQSLPFTDQRGYLRGALEKRQVKSGTSWRFVYRDATGRQKKVKIGVTRKRVAKQRKAQLEAMLAMGQDPAEELRTHGALTLSELMDTDAAWAANHQQLRIVQLNREIMNRFIAWAGDVKLKPRSSRRIQGGLVLDAPSYTIVR